MKLKRIAMISYHTCPLASQEGKETGGMNVYVLEIAKKVGEIGYPVDIFTRSESKTGEKVVMVSSSVRVIHTIAGPEKALSKMQLKSYTSEFVRNIIIFNSREGNIYDIIHSHYYLSGLAGILLMRTFKNARHVLTFHTLALMKNLVARDSHELEDRERIDAEHQLAQKANRIIALSESDRKYISYLYNTDLSRISVVNPGVDTAIFKPIPQNLARKVIGADNNHKLILFVGRIEPLKGIDSLLYAVKILTSRYPKYRGKICLWIVGGDISQQKSLWSMELKKLEQLRQILGIKTEVNFVGKRPQKELPFYYSAADVVVMPSHYETFGIVALEALACNTPVISTHVTGVSSTIESRRNLHIVPANSPIDLASQIEYLIAGNRSAIVDSQMLQKNVAAMTWAKAAAKTVATYTIT